MRWLYAAVCALLLGLRAPGRHALVPDSDLVPAPEQVSVQCSDHRPRVSWSCPQCNSNYNVTITGTENRTWITSRMDQDLGEFVWGQKQMLDFMYVDVTAIRDRTSPDQSSPDRSSPSRSQSFSYSRLKTVDVRCGLLLPLPLNLSMDSSGFMLRIENPLYYYTELDTIKDSTFTYSIYTPESQQDQPCEVPVCVAMLKLADAAHDVCVNVSGTINRGSEEILLQSESVCAAPSGQDSSLWVVAILVVLIFVIVIVVVTTLICKTRAWVFPKIPSPKTLIPHPQRRSFTCVSPTVYSQVQVLSPKDPDLDLDTESPSLGSEHGLIQENRKLLHKYSSRGLLEEQDQNDFSDSTQTLSLHSTGSEEQEDQQQEDQQQEDQQQEDQQQEDQQQEDQQQEDQQQHSNYERRPDIIVQINMGGDLVTGYRA